LRNLFHNLFHSVPIVPICSDLLQADLPRPAGLPGSDWRNPFALLNCSMPNLPVYIYSGMQVQGVGVVM
jgi:hypothetical protein